MYNKLHVSHLKNVFHAYIYVIYFYIYIYIYIYIYLVCIGNKVFINIPQIITIIPIYYVNIYVNYRNCHSMLYILLIINGRINNYIIYIYIYIYI